MEYELITFNDKRLVFLPNEVLLIEVDDETFKLLKSGEADTLESLRQISKKYSLPIRNVSPEINVSSLVLSVAHQCNLNCVYCYGDRGTYDSKGLMSFDTAKRAITFFFEKGQGNVGISFFGGEPLLNLPVIEKTVSFAKHYLGNGVKFGITTNATLITDDIAEFLSENDFFVTVSLDGRSWEHDKLRVGKNGEGTYHSAIVGLNRLRKSGVKNINIRATITRYNCSLLDIVEHFASFGLPFSVQIVSTSSEDLKPSPEVLESCIKKYAQKLFELAQEEKYEEALKRMFGLVKFSIRVLYQRGKRFYPCGGGRKAVVVNPNGDVYICHRLDGDHIGKVGNVLKESRGEVMNRLSNIFSSLIKTVDQLKPCNECWARYICGGRCYHESIVEKGNINEVPENSCEYKKALIKIGLILYSMLPSKVKESAVYR